MKCCSRCFHWPEMHLLFKLYVGFALHLDAKGQPLTNSMLQIDSLSFFQVKKLPCTPSNFSVVGWSGQCGTKFSQFTQSPGQVWQKAFPCLPSHLKSLEMTYSKDKMCSLKTLSQMCHSWGGFFSPTVYSRKFTVPLSDHLIQTELKVRKHLGIIVW